MVENWFYRRDFNLNYFKCCFINSSCSDSDSESEPEFTPIKSRIHRRKKKHKKNKNKNKSGLESDDPKKVKNEKFQENEENADNGKTVCNNQYCQTCYQLCIIIIIIIVF